MKINDILDVYNEVNKESGKDTCYVCSSYYERSWGDNLKVTSTIHNCVGAYSKKVISANNIYKCPLGKESEFTQQNELKVFKLFLKSLE